MLTHVRNWPTFADVEIRFGTAIAGRTQTAPSSTRPTPAALLLRLDATDAAPTRKMNKGQSAARRFIRLVGAITHDRSQLTPAMTARTSPQVMCRLPRLKRGVVMVRTTAVSIIQRANAN